MISCQQAVCCYLRPNWPSPWPHYLRDHNVNKSPHFQHNQQHHYFHTHLIVFLSQDYWALLIQRYLTNCHSKVSSLICSLQKKNCSSPLIFHCLQTATKPHSTQLAIWMSPTNKQDERDKDSVVRNTKWLACERVKSVVFTSNKHAVDRRMSNRDQITEKM